MEINISFGSKNKLPKLKKVKEPKVKPVKVKKEKKIKKPRQYSKIIIDMVIILVYVTTLSGIYINLKNGFSMDIIVTEILKALAVILTANATKSYFETKEEKRMEFMKELKGLAFDDNGNPITHEQIGVIKELMTAQFSKFGRNIGNQNNGNQNIEKEV